MPLHSSTVTAVRTPRLAQFAAIAAVATATAGAVTVALTDDRPAPQIRTIAESAQPAPSRYLDREANKAASISALGRHVVVPRSEPVSRYQDIEANKARSQSAR